MRPLATALLLTFCLSSVMADDIGALVEKRCGSCHIVSNPTIENVKHMSAPPMWGVARNLQRHFKSKEAFVDFVVDYVQNPSADKIVLDKAAMERFGLMPSLKGTVSKEELEKIADYLHTHY